MANSDETLGTAQDIMDLAGAYQECRALLAAVELDLFSAVAETDGTPAALADKLQADERGVDRLCNALTAMGLLAKGDGAFANTALSGEHLVKESPGYLGMLDHMAHQYKTWAGLDEAVRKGARPGDTSRSMADWDTERFKPFIGAMHNRAKGHADDLMQRFDMAGVERVLDVGGGSGVYAMALVRANPGVTADVLELEQVTPLAREHIAAAGLEDRVQAVAGDFMRDDMAAVTGGGYDFVFLSAIVHMLSPEQNLALLRQCHGVLKPGGRVAVQDFIMDEGRTTPRKGAVFALNMLVSTPAGDTYTESEIREWLAEAGFESMRRIETGPTTAAIVGAKPA